MLIIKNLYYCINAYLAVILFFFVEKNKDYWVIGGQAGNLYNDNAKVFHEYVLSNWPNINIIWFANKGGPAWSKVSHKKVNKGSVKGYLCFYQSNVALFSDTFNLDIAPYAYMLPIVRSIYFKKYKVYLGHGTIAFKKMPKSNKLLEKLKKNIFNSYNLAIASTKLECLAMCSYGINPSSIRLLGSARHDQLVNVDDGTNTILIAPTWRKWLTNLRKLEGSDFYINYSKLLTDTTLVSYLRKNDIRLVFYIHHMLLKYKNEFDIFNNDVITILAPSSDLSHYIMSSNILITDYSSVCSDFYFLQKPVLFFQFDQYEFIERTDSEIDLLNDKFGVVKNNVDDLVSELVKTIDANFIISPLQKDGEKYFAGFVDRNNCSRIIEAIFQAYGGQIR